MKVRSSWRIGHAAINREARLDRSGRHELQSATDQISADDGVHFSSRRFANRLELQSFSLAPAEIECYEFGADDVGLGSAAGTSIPLEFLGSRTPSGPAVHPDCVNRPDT